MRLAVVKTANYVAWYKTQTAKFQAQVEKRLSNVEQYGHFGHVKDLGGGLAEIKFNNGVRIYFSRTGANQITLILGGNKNGQSKDIAKAKPFSLEDMPVVKLRDGVKAEKYSPTAQLKDVDFTIKALSVALLDGDHQAIKEIIRNHFEVMNAAKVLKDAHISKRTFYEAVSEKGNPRLKTLVQIIHAMRAV